MRRGHPGYQPGRWTTCSPLGFVAGILLVTTSASAGDTQLGFVSPATPRQLSSPLRVVPALTSSGGARLSITPLCSLKKEGAQARFGSFLGRGRKLTNINSGGVGADGARSRFPGRGQDEPVAWERPTRRVGKSVSAGWGRGGMRGMGGKPTGLLRGVLRSTFKWGNSAVARKEFVPKENVWTPPRSNSAVKEAQKEVPKLRLGADLEEDIRTRSQVYKSDWTDGVNHKSLPSILFLYFACLLPAVAFGGISAQVTGGCMGVIEYIIACGVGGVSYALFSGQPMTLIGPTGLTLAFITALYSFTSAASLPFLPVYTWVGLWTAAMLMVLSVGGASRLIEYATQFTDDVFNALLAVNFIYEACRSLIRDFGIAVKMAAAGTAAATAAGRFHAGPLMGINVALATFVGSQKAAGARDWRYFNGAFREFVSDFGPVMVIVAMSAFSALPAVRGSLSFLEVPSGFMLSQGRGWLSPMWSVPMGIRVLCAIPAFLLTSLFFLDQNISSRVVNSPRHKMKKGAAYHLDLFVLSIITAVLSLFGLPWQCAATVQSLNHVRAMATVNVDKESAGGAKVEEIQSVYETRVTGLGIHTLVLASLGLLPLLRGIPMPVVSGIFLYLGRKVMNGNGFLCRISELGTDRSLLKEDNSSIKRVGISASLRYTAVQVSMLALLWTLKSFKRTALFFPSVIGLLIVVRLFALPKMFTSKELNELDAAVG